jgi:hypothetical protein
VLHSLSRCAEQYIHTGLSWSHFRRFVFCVGLVPASDNMRLFWAGLPEAKIDAKGGAMVLRLKKGTHFLGNVSCGSSLMVRDCYGRLQDRIEAHFGEGGVAAAVIGNPGKTLYILRKTQGLTVSTILIYILLFALQGARASFCWLRHYVSWLVGSWVGGMLSAAFEYDFSLGLLAFMSRVLHFLRREI